MVKIPKHSFGRLSQITDDNRLSATNLPQKRIIFLYFRGLFTLQIHGTFWQNVSLEAMLSILNWYQTSVMQNVITMITISSCQHWIAGKSEDVERNEWYLSDMSVYVYIWTVQSKIGSRGSN